MASIQQLKPFERFNASIKLTNNSVTSQLSRIFRSKLQHRPTMRTTTTRYSTAERWQGGEHQDDWKSKYFRARSRYSRFRYPINPNRIIVRVVILQIRRKFPQQKIPKRNGRRGRDSVVQVENIAETTVARMKDLRISNSHRFDETQTVVHANKDARAEADKVGKVAQSPRSENKSFLPTRTRTAVLRYLFHAGAYPGFLDGGTKF